MRDDLRFWLQGAMEGMRCWVCLFLVGRWGDWNVRGWIVFSIRQVVDGARCVCYRRSLGGNFENKRNSRAARSLYLEEGAPSKVSICTC